MSVDKNKMAADCWRKANEAMQAEQFDYAVDMLFRAMLLVPDNVLYRQTLRGAERKMYKDNGSGARMSGMKLMKPKGRIKKAKFSKDWKAVDQAAEDGLKINPWDASLNAAVGEACANLEYNEVAVFCYELALKAEPQNKEFNRHYAILQEERGNYRDAISAWHRICKIDPDDQEARSKLTQLEANSMMKKSGMDEAKSSQEMKTAYDYDRKSGSGRQKQPADGPGTSPEADLQRMIRKEPENKDHYLKLADLYKRAKRYEESAEQLKLALDLSGNDATIREQLENVELDVMRQNHESAKEAAAANPDDETAKKNAVALAREILLREVEVFSSRVTRYPKDSRLKFDLAKRQMQLAEYSKAIPLLQQALSDSRIEADVLVSLGKCFLYEKKNVLALRQFEKAKDLVNAQENQNQFKDVHYWLGRLYGEAGKNDQAEEHYQEVLGVDYEYRDTLKRLEDLQSGE